MLASSDYLEILDMNFQYFMSRKREQIRIRRNEKNINKYVSEFLEVSGEKSQSAKQAGKHREKWKLEKSS